MARKKGQVKSEERYQYKECPEGLNFEVYHKIRQRRLQMLVHSFLYYRLDTNVVSDYDFDKWAKELFELQRDYPEESKSCDLYKEFRDWTGASGYHLPQYDWVNEIAQRLLRYKAKEKEGGI